MRRQLNNIISVCWTALRLNFYKICNGGGKLSYNAVERISPNVVLEFNRGSTVKLGKRIRIHSGSKIKVRPGAQLSIGDNVKINYGCIIACHNQITIGEGTEFGPSVYLYDHDHDYKKGLSENSNQECFKKAPITIGKNCWIGANTVILRGTTLGDNCVVGAGSVVKGQYESNFVIIKRERPLYSA